VALAVVAVMEVTEIQTTLAEVPVQEAILATAVKEVIIIAQLTRQLVQAAVVAVVVAEHQTLQEAVVAWGFKEKALQEPQELQTFLVEVDLEEQAEQAPVVYTVEADEVQPEKRIVAVLVQMVQFALSGAEIEVFHQQIPLMTKALRQV
jgi:hypothetical protein